MTPLRREPPPSFWETKDRAWRARDPDFGADPLRWQHQKKTLGAWFHETVQRGLRLCAYCDNSLTEASRETIDHFLPVHEFGWLALDWGNLYPACDRCNSKNKGARWSCRLLRPDLDPVERWLDFNPLTGAIVPAPGIERSALARVRLTLRILKLNSPERMQGRLRVVRAVVHASKSEDRLALAEHAEVGPYRFVARSTIASLEPR